MIFVPGRSNLSEDVDTAILIALELKRRWLNSEDNSKRIKASGLLPTELAIGIHVGKVFINENNESNQKSVYRPEGYAINLTKRVESASREGKFTRIFLSEAARGELYDLTDERTYTFGPQRLIQAKGISRDIIVFEIHHHFLPTDWSYYLFTEANKSKAIIFEPIEEHLELIQRARQANPTNLWLAEEYIFQKLVFENARLEKLGLVDNNIKKKEAYYEALKVAQRISTGDLRDAGILTICGQICGEMENFEKEQDYYKEAIDLDPNYAEAHWYLGYSLSYQLLLKLDPENKNNPEITFDDLHLEDKKTVEQIIDSYKRSIDIDPKQSWVFFDLAAEYARWGFNQAIEKLEHAVSLNPSIVLAIEGEIYFDSLQSLPRFKKLLRK